MRFTIVCREDVISQGGKDKIEQRLCAAGFVIDAIAPELIISVGGDGTLLEAFRQYHHMVSDALFVGVHSGNLGFYTDWMLAEIDTFTAAVIKGEYSEETFPLLQTDVMYKNGHQTFLALNEITISDYQQTLALNVYIDDILFETFRGTGFCASTPSGSTAYNKSLGGTLVHPSIRAFQLTEMASINNKVYRTIGSSLMFSDQQKVKIEFLDVKNDVVFTNDHISGLQDTPVEIYLSMPKQQIRFAQYRKFQFWTRVKNAFID